MTALAVPQFNILKFPLGGAQQELNRVSRMFSGAFRNTFQSVFAKPDTAAAFTPTQLTGLKLWYAPRNLGLADGTAISTNTDNSGNGWDATAATTDRPTFKTNIVNGLAIARYNGANKMAIASGANPITNNIGSITIVCVASTASVAAGGVPTFYIQKNIAATRIIVGMNFSAGKMWAQGRRLDGDSSVNVNGSTSLSTNTFYIFATSATYTSDTVKGWLNGGSADLSNTAWHGTSGNTSATDSAGMFLGGNNGFLQGDIGDQLVYIPALSLSDLNLLGAYLGTLYNLTWTTAT